MPLRCIHYFRKINIIFISDMYTVYQELFMKFNQTLIFDLILYSLRSLFPHRKTEEAFDFGKLFILAS